MWVVKTSWQLHCLPSLLKPRAQFQSSPPEECDILPSTTSHVYCEGWTALLQGHLAVPSPSFLQLPVLSAHNYHPMLWFWDKISKWFWDKILRHNSLCRCHKTPHLYLPCAKVEHIRLWIFWKLASKSQQQKDRNSKTTRICAHSSLPSCGWILRE